MRRLPTNVKIMRGTHRPDRSARNEPKPTGIPSCPRWLDPVAKAEWKRILPELKRMKLISRVDLAALAGYCQCYADLRAAVETLRKEGTTVLTGNGYPVQHPAVAMRNKSLALLRVYIAEFGLSPASRSKVDASAPAGEGGDDGWDELLA